MSFDLGRRAFVKASGALGLLALLPECGGSSGGSSGSAKGGAGRFLDAHELATLRAVTARFVPGPPEDPDPGAIEAGAAEAIDMLLGAFGFAVPPIHAGGPFSDRAGATHDAFADFVPLDAQVELGWRIRIEGSQGLPEREFAGPVLGLQEIYRTGLAKLDERAQAQGGTDFVDAPAATQDQILADSSDEAIATFAGAALANTLEAVYGAPEYGGNRNRVGWTYTSWDGDVEPRGYTDSEVSDGPGAGAAGEADLASIRDAAPLVERLLVEFAGRAAPRQAFWLARPGYGRR